MSVVNKMLQDLEARKAQPDSSADYQPPVKSKSARVWLYVPLAILVVGVVFWMLWGEQKPEESHIANPTISRSDINASDTVAETQALTNESQKIAQFDGTVGQESEQGESESAPQQPLLTPEQLQAYSFNQNTPSALQAQRSAGSDKRIQSNATQTSETSGQSQVAPRNLIAEASATDVGQSTLVSVKSRSSEASSQNASVKSVSESSDDSVFQVRSSQNVDTVEGLTQQAQIAIKRGDENEAIALLSKLIDKAPGAVSARKRLAAMLFGQGKHLQADDVLKQGVQLQPDDHDLRLMQARLWVQMKNPTKAHDLLSAYQGSAVQTPDYVAFRASLAQQVSRFDSAKIDYTQLAQSQPANARWWLGLAVAEERLGNTKPALQAYQYAKELKQLSTEVDEFVEQRIQYLAGIN